MDPQVLPVATCSAIPHTLLPLASQPFVTVACDYVYKVHYLLDEYCTVWFSM